MGAGLQALPAARHLIETFDGRPPARGMGAVLVPWPNRTAHGRWRWNGADQQLALTEPAAGNAIHGLLHVLYRVASARPTPSRWSPSSRRSRVAGPLDHGSATPSTGRLTVTHTVRNVGLEPVPFGVGAHPYLRAGDALIDDCVLTVSAATAIPLDGGLPTGPATAVPAALDLRGGRPVKELDLDNAFGGAAPAEGDTHIRHHLAAPDGTTELWADPVFGYVQVFTPPDLVGRGRAVAVEPMTCPPDALNSGDGLITLAADATWSTGVR